MRAAVPAFARTTNGRRLFENECRNKDETDS